MARIWADRVYEESTTTGTGAFTLSGAVTGFRTFASVCATSDVVYYCIEAVDGNGVPSGDWEVGIGTYSGTNTLTRTTVIASSNSNSAVSFSAGTKRVMLTPNAGLVRGIDTRFSPPLAADFTGYSGDGTTPSGTDDPDVGMLVSLGTSVTGEMHRIFAKALPGGTGSWEVTARFGRQGPRAALHMGLACLNVAQSDLVGIGLLCNGTGQSYYSEALYRATALSSSYTQVSTFDVMENYQWYKLGYNSGSDNIYAQWSNNGKQWNTISPLTVGRSTAFGSAYADRVGFAIHTNASNTRGLYMSCDYWEQSW